MNCPKCITPMDVAAQIRWQEENKPITTPTVYRCTRCGYRTELIEYNM